MDTPHADQVKPIAPHTPPPRGVDDSLAEPTLGEWLRREKWRLVIASALLMVAFATSLQMLFPKPSPLSWFFVVVILGSALEMSFLFAYFGTGRHAGAQTPLRRALWGGAGAIVGVVSTLAGIQLGAGKPLADVFTRREMWAVVIIAISAMIVVSFVYIQITKLRARQHHLRLLKAQVDTAHERLAKRNMEAELKLMQAQVEPHFLYNTLANLRYLTESRSPMALEMIDHIIDYLRLSLPGFRAEVAPLRDETALARAYLAIMEIRMGGKLRATIEIPDELLDVPLPPLLVLTLVENAVKHGIARAPDGGEIVVSARANHDQIELCVADTGVGLAGMGSTRVEQANRTGVGLANVRDRLAATYGNEAVLTLTANAPRGAIARILLPRTKAAT
jgi:signal transduction histidine kinase